MRKVKPRTKMKYCRYYMKGQKECPFPVGSEERWIWLSEKSWATDTVDHLVKDSDYEFYCRHGLADFAQDDTTPAPLKGKLYAGFRSWRWHLFVKENMARKEQGLESLPKDCVKDSTEEFRQWYHEVYMAGGDPPRGRKRKWHPMTESEFNEFWDTKVRRYNKAYAIGSIISAILMILMLSAILN